MTANEEVARLLAGKKTVNHILHAVLTVVTFGIWGIVWLCCFAHAAQYNSKIDDQVRMIEFSRMASSE